MISRVCYIISSVEVGQDVIVGSQGSITYFSFPCFYLNNYFTSNNLLKVSKFNPRLCCVKPLPTRSTPTCKEVGRLLPYRKCHSRETCLRGDSHRFFIYCC